jgi:hypothetical protein
MVEPDVDLVITLAMIIREVDGNHSLGASSLAEAILRHPSITVCLANHHTTADWQLEQVIEWLRDNLDGDYVWADVFSLAEGLDAIGSGIDAERVIDDLRQAMRPTTTQEEN